MLLTFFAMTEIAPTHLTTSAVEKKESASRWHALVVSCQSIGWESAIAKGGRAQTRIEIFVAIPWQHATALSHLQVTLGNRLPQRSNARTPLAQWRT
jgi:hypothetical protein